MAGLDKQEIIQETEKHVFLANLLKTGCKTVNPSINNVFFCTNNKQKIMSASILSILSNCSSVVFLFFK